MHGCRALTLPWYPSNTITNRKWPMRNPMVVRPMTSRDLKGELVTSILLEQISQKRLEIDSVPKDHQ